MTLIGIFTFSMLGLLVLSLLALLASNGITSARKQKREQDAINAEIHSLDEAKKERRKCLH